MRVWRECLLGSVSGAVVLLAISAAAASAQQLQAAAVTGMAASQPAPALPADAPPPRPIPPDGAAPSVVVPPIGPDGLRKSVARGASPTQNLWNLRSAWNVASLDCPLPQYQGVSDGYSAFLTGNVAMLSAAHATTDDEFRARFGAHASIQHETYMTQLYNHYALPPTKAKFCDAVAAMAASVAAAPPADWRAFATTQIAQIELVFDDFYTRFAQWQADAAAWDAKYAPPPQPTKAKKKTRRKVTRKRRH